MILKGLQLSIGILLILLNATDSLKAHYFSTPHFKADAEDHPSSIICFCHDLMNTVNLPNVSVSYIYKHVQAPNYCTSGLPRNVCDMLKNCEYCYATMQTCSPIDGSYACKKSELIVDNGINLQNQMYLHDGQLRTLGDLINPLMKKNLANDSHVVVQRDVPSEIGIDSNHKINLTLLHLCHFPPTMRTQELVITFSNHSTIAIQRCIRGYTFPEGISRTLVCSHEKNYWEPTKFEECRPYVDCTLSLISKGSISCDAPTAWMSKKCNVTCDAVALFKPVQGVYKCDVHGLWTPSLPFCALSVGAGYDLVPAPKVKFHSKHIKKNLSKMEYTEEQYEDKVTEALQHLEKVIEEERRPKMKAWYERSITDVLKEVKNLDKPEGSELVETGQLYEAQGNKIEEISDFTETHGDVETDYLVEVSGNGAMESQNLDEANENEAMESHQLDIAYGNKRLETEYLNEAYGDQVSETKHLNKVYGNGSMIFILSNGNDEHNELEIILLDDAYINKAIKPEFFYVVDEKKDVKIKHLDEAFGSNSFQTNHFDEWYTNEMLDTNNSSEVYGDKALESEGYQEEELNEFHENEEYMEPDTME